MLALAGKLLLTLDRTTWEAEDAPLNVLVLSVVLHSYTLPLVWTALEHDGNSSTDVRLDVVRRLLKAPSSASLEGALPWTENSSGESGSQIRRPPPSGAYSGRPRCTGNGCGWW